ncbi:MAG: hypothetical protein GY791_17590, partial [Alphaproteobacteria bacterium]|nr:hypothetical protein [Alphaproteobacteria bacterium]
ERAFVFIVEAESNDELDRLLRNLPAWGVLEWDVVPLQSFAGRSDQERSIAADLKKVLG